MPAGAACAELSERSAGTFPPSATDFSRGNSISLLWNLPGGGRPRRPAAPGERAGSSVCGAAERSETESSSDKKEGKQKMMRFLFIFLG